jgi:hypothetical protein
MVTFSVSGEFFLDRLSETDRTDTSMRLKFLWQVARTESLIFDDFSLSQDGLDTLELASVSPA